MKYVPFILSLVLFASVVTWNGVRFRTDEKAIRTKDLSFLPSPEIAKVLAFGHDNSLARLRWIDAFAYFQLQLDRQDDTVPGGGRGFERLYDTLIALDPHFEPFYQHAALAVGGVLHRHDRALGFLLRGTLNLPHTTTLWRHAAAILYSNFKWDERTPWLMDGFLAAWSADEQDELQRRQVWDWKAAMARRRYHGLEQLPYWLDRLPETKAKTAMGDYIEVTIRDQLVKYAVAELNAVLADRRAAGLPVERIEDLLDPPRLKARQLDLRWGPVGADAQGLPLLRGDPYGYPYQLHDGAVISLGQAYLQFTKRAHGVDIRGLQDLEAIRAAAIELPVPPPGAGLQVQHGRLDVVLPDPPLPPLALR